MNTLTLETPAADTKRRTVGIVLLGCGTVGRGLVELLRSNGPLLAQRAGADLRLRKVLVRDLARDRGLPPALLTDDAEEALTAPDVDVIVELAGGLEPARAWIARALATGRHVVTANKALLAHHGPELFALARENGVSLGFSASVCGALPVLGAISSGLAGNRVESLCGIVNGTCNYILTRMSESGLTFDEALREAQQAGFAEADPSLDVDGHDATQKLAVLAGVAFGAWVHPADIHVEGIRRIAPQDMRAAREMGYVIKHVVTAGEHGPAAQPTLLPQSHALARIRNEQNAVLVRGDAAGEMLFTGAGAGSLPTAGSVLADLVEIARGAPASLMNAGAVPVGLRARAESAYYLRFPIVDVPGIIGLIATALGSRGISIRHARAELDPAIAGAGNVYMLVHKCPPEALELAINHIANLPTTRSRPMAIAIHEEA